MGDPTSPASALLVVGVLGLCRDNVCNVLKVGKSARCLGPTQSTGDEVEALPTAVEAVKDALTSGVELIDPVDRAPVSCDVGGQPPVARALTGLEHEPEGGLGPSQEVQEPLGEGFPGAVLPPVSGGVVWGEGLEGVRVDFGACSSHGSLGHGGVSWAPLDEARQGLSPQVGDEEVGEVAVVREEPLWPGGGSRGDGGCSDSDPQVGNVSLQALDGGLIGLCALEEGVGGDLCNLSEVVGLPPGAEGLQDGEGGLGGDASLREDGLNKCRRGGW